MTEISELIKRLICEEVGECPNFCPHGGCCMLKEGHDGLHNSGYCKWKTSESINKEEADKLIMSNK